MEDLKNTPLLLPEHNDENKIVDLSKISEKEELSNAELEKERSFKEGLADNSSTDKK